MSVPSPPRPLRAAATGALAGAACGLLDFALVLGSTASHWLGPLELAEALAVYGLAGGALAGALGLLLRPLHRRWPAVGGAAPWLVAGLAVLVGVAGVGFGHNYDTRMTSATSGDPRGYVAWGAAAVIAALVAGLLARRRGGVGARGLVAGVALLFVAGLVGDAGLRLAEVRRAAPRGASAAAGGTTPNVVLLVMDTTRRDALSAYGHPGGTTPVLDRLAEEGLRFTRAYSTSSWTPPSHASLFTGLYPSGHGTYSTQIRLAADRPTVAELFRDAGYDTVFVSEKGTLARSRGWTRGFDRSLVHNVEDRVSFLYHRVAERLGRQAYATGNLVDLALGEIELARRRGRPFFLFLNLNTPHGPYVGRQPWLDRLTAGIDRGSLDRAKIGRVVRNQDGLIAAVEGRIVLSEAEHAWVRALYDSQVAAMDLEIGRLVAALERIAVDEPVVLLVTADHGEVFWEHGLMGHGPYVYQELVHVPLILWARPSLGRGTVERPVSGVDVMPTFAELLGLPPERLPESDGESLLAERDRRRIFAEVWIRPKWAPPEGVGEPSWEAAALGSKAAVELDAKLVWQYPDERRLFDLAADPGELRDLAAERPDLAAELHRALAARFELEDLEVPDQLDPEILEQLEAIGYF